MPDTQTPLERAARALAEALGRDYDTAFENKAEWIEARGMRGGHFIDCNEPYRGDYDEAARDVLMALREPSEGMVDAFVQKGLTVTLGGDYKWPDYARDQWAAMIDAAMTEGEGEA